MINFHGDAAADSHFTRVAEEGEASDVCDGVDRALIGFVCARRFRCRASAASRFRRVMEAVAALDPGFLGLALLQSRGDNAGSEGLCEDEDIAGARADILPDVFVDG